MAIEQTVEKAPGSRLVLLTAVLSLTIVSAAAFGRVFQGVRPSLQLMAAAGVAVLLAGVLDRQHVLIAALASAAGLAVAVGLLVFHSTTKFGLLPTPTTFRAAVRAWEAIGQIAATEVAPTPAFAPLFLAALTAVWAASFSAHSLASRARSPFLALLPPAGLLAFTSIILEEGGRPLYVLVFLSSAIAVLFADGLRRVGQWGPVTAWHGRRRLRFGTSASLRGARWVAALSLAVAVFLPGILPGYRAKGLVEVHGTPSTVHVAIDPIVQIRPNLRLTRPISLFSVRTTNPAYWRFLTLDTFTGKLWTASDLDASGGRPVLRDPLQPNVQIEAANGRLVEQHFQFLRLSQRWLPAASEPVAYRGAPARYDPESGALVVPGGASTDFSYDVQSLEVVPTDKELQAIPAVDAFGSRRYTQLPRDMLHLAEITAIAKRITRGAQTPYAKAIAIQNYLRSPNNFTYKEDVPAGHGSDDILNFLTKTRAGYCEQFAGTMAVLLRTLGLPARVAVGFTPGTLLGRQGQATILRVTTEQAHAWVEVLFPRYGWLAFEPTPTRFNPVAATYDFPIPASSGRGGPAPPGQCQVRSRGSDFAQACTQTNPTSTPTPARPIGDPPGARRPSGETATADHGPSRGALIWAGLLAVALLILVGIPVVKVWRRRLILSRAKAPADRVLAAFRVLTDQAGDVGLERTPAETLREYGTRLTGSVQGLEGSLGDLTGLAGRAAYSANSLSSIDAEHARSSARRAARLIRRSAGMQQRVVGWFRLRRRLVPRWATG
jgi:transglutaminase-like putative cysteine protease